MLNNRLNREQQESQFGRSLAEQALARQNQEQLTREGRTQQQTQFDTVQQQQSKQYDEQQRMEAFKAIATGIALPKTEDIANRQKTQDIMRDHLGVDIPLPSPQGMNIGGQDLVPTLPREREAFANQEALKKEKSLLELRAKEQQDQRQAIASQFKSINTALKIYDPATEGKMLTRILIPGLPNEDNTQIPKELAGKGILLQLYGSTPTEKSMGMKMTELAVAAEKAMQPPPASLYPSPSFALHRDSFAIAGEVSTQARAVLDSIRPRLGNTGLSDAQIMTAIAQKLLETRVKRGEVDRAAVGVAMDNISKILGAPPIKQSTDIFDTSSQDSAALSKILEELK
jgi:hypothetical protein